MATLQVATNKGTVTQIQPVEQLPEFERGKSFQYTKQSGHDIGQQASKQASNHKATAKLWVIIKPFKGAISD